MRAYGLKLNSLEVEEANSRCATHNFSLDDPPSTVPTNTSSTSKYSTLTEDGKKSGKSFIFNGPVQCEQRVLLSTNNGVWWTGLPRSHLVKQCKNHLNGLSHLTVTPGKSQGVQTSFKKLLREQIIDVLSYITFMFKSLSSTMFM